MSMIHSLTRRLRHNRFAFEMIERLRRDSTILDTQALDADQLEAYERDGYIVAREFFTPDELQALIAHIDGLKTGTIPAAGKTQFEWEPYVQENERTLENHSSVRQIWDYVPHDTALTAAVKHPRLCGAVSQLLGRDIKLYRSTVLLKQAGQGSELPYHQDSSYWPIAPANLTCCWIALHDADRLNGCMKVIPGSHKGSLLPVKSVGVHQSADPAHVDLSREQVLEMPAGSVLFFSSRLAHGTDANRSPRNRYALIMSYMNSRSKYTGSDPAPQFPRIAGRSFWGCV
jgi:phytanoyl-CoA hydroxylase